MTSGASEKLLLTVAGVRDRQLVRSDWTGVDEIGIDGVDVKLIASVLTDNGALTELWRADWMLDPHGVGQVFQRTLNRGALSAWHVHLQTTDRLVCATGQILIALFDAREASPTRGAIATIRMGERRPGIVTIPPGVYHGARNLADGPSTLVNIVDIAYCYESPDHLRAPADSPEIPYRW
jgi:dTDP-4-dehydrorhamnose 3,5-epimerase